MACCAPESIVHRVFREEDGKWETLSENNSYEREIRVIAFEAECRHRQPHSCQLYSQAALMPQHS